MMMMQEQPPVDQMSYQEEENPPLAEEYSLKNYSERPHWAEYRHDSGIANENDSVNNCQIPIHLEWLDSTRVFIHNDE